MRVFVLVSLVLTLGPDSVAQRTGVVWGVITDGQGEPLPGASVQVGGTQRGGYTDVDGWYQIGGVPVGRVAIQAGYAGYQRAVIDTVLAASSLRLDIALPEVCVGTSELSYVFYPPGQVSDLPALGGWGAGQVGRATRPIETVALEPVAARVSRTVAWDRATEALGRWRPTMPGLGRPQVYIGGLPALSLDAVPVASTESAGAFAGYLPARYGGAAAGSVVVEARGGGSGGEAFAGATGPDASAEIRAGATRQSRDAMRCHALVGQTSVFGEAAVVAGRESVEADGRAIVEQVWRPAHLYAHARAGQATNAFGDGGSAGGLADVRTDHYEPVLLTLGADRAWGPSGTSTLLAGRAEATVRTRVPVQIGAELSTRQSTRSPAVRSVSAAAIYGERQFGQLLPKLFGRRPTVTGGARVERFGLADGAVWTVQPRVLVEAYPSDDTPYLYGAALAGPDAAGASLRRRLEAGAGLRTEVLGRQRPLGLRAGAHGYVRSVTGALAGEVVGLDAEVEVALDRRPASAAVSLRLRTEWGDDALARRRATAALAVDTGGAGVLRVLGGRVRAFADVADGVGGQRVVEVGGEWQPGWLGAIARWLRVSRAPSLHGRGVVAGRDAVPCADGPEAVACPVPVAEIALRMAW